MKGTSYVVDVAVGDRLVERGVVLVVRGLELVGVGWLRVVRLVLVARVVCMEWLARVTAAGEWARVELLIASGLGSVRG
jgi:hypothetical protein